MSWKNTEKWQAMISGADCPMCSDIHLEENAFSYLVAELPTSYVRLPKNQDIHGRILVALKRHANELYELPPDELSGFWADVATASKAVREAFDPVKIYYGVFGGQCPHIHCHIMPMRESDDPHAALMMGQSQRFLDESECKTISGRLRRLMGG